MSTASRYMDDFYVAGMRYWDGATVLGKLSAGKKLKLKPEFDNKYDPNAIAIYYKKTKLGYVPRDKNYLAAQLLRFGHKDVLECRILQVNKKAEPYKQVSVGLYIADNK